jgi:hypothetical protein
MQNRTERCMAAAIASTIWLDTQFGPRASVLHRECVKAYIDCARQPVEVIDIGCARHWVDRRDYYDYLSVVSGVDRDVSGLAYTTAQPVAFFKGASQ